MYMVMINKKAFLSSENHYAIFNLVSMLFDFVLYLYSSISVNLLG